MAPERLRFLCSTHSPRRLQMLNQTPALAQFEWKEVVSTVAMVSTSSSRGVRGGVWETSGLGLGSIRSLGSLPRI